MKLVSGLFLMAALTGCATNAKYVEYMDSWKGASEAQIVDAMGIPDGSYVKDSWKYLTYNRQNGDENCKTVIVLEKDVVIKWEASGNNCVSNKTSRFED